MKSLVVALIASLCLFASTTDANARGRRVVRNNVVVVNNIGGRRVLRNNVVVVNNGFVGRRAFISNNIVVTPFGGVVAVNPFFPVVTPNVVIVP